MSTTLRLDPAIAERRRAAKVAGMPAALIVAPEPTTHVAGGVLKTEGIDLNSQASGEVRQPSKPAKPTQLNSQPSAIQPKDTPSKKALKKAGMRALRRRLKALWPHLFSRADVPLAIGIRCDIAKHLSEEEQNWLAPTLAAHCRTPAYLHALMQPGACRVDLQGNLTPVSPEHAASAANR